MGLESESVPESVSRNVMSHKTELDVKRNWVRVADVRRTCACGDVNPEVERSVVPVQDLIVYDRQLICVNTKNTTFTDKNLNFS